MCSPYRYEPFSHYYVASSGNYQLVQILKLHLQNILAYKFKFYSITQYVVQFPFLIFFPSDGLRVK